MKILIKLTLSFCGLGLLTGCNDQNTDHSEIRQTGFVYCGQGTPDTFNPQLVDSGITAESLGPQIYDTLLILDPETQRPSPNLAERWTVNEQGTVYTFYLRHHVPFQHTKWFSPSRNLNAEDVVFSFDRILSSYNPFHNISNSHYPWFAGINFKHLVKSVDALDPYTVQFTLRRPDNSFLANISTTHAVILSKEYADQLIYADEKSMIDTHPVGTGPFYLDEMQVSDFIRLKRHPLYWKGLPKMQQVVFDIAQRGTGTLAKLLRNECDVLSTPISSQIPIIEQQKHILLSSTPAMNVSFIAVNTTHPAISDPRVRKALSFAINRQNILDSVYYGTGRIAYNILPPTSWAYQKDAVQVRYDHSYALGLLRDAGFSNGLELSMLVPLEPTAYNPSPRKTAELIQANLKDIGIKLHLIPEERIDRQNRSDYADVDLYLTGWSGRTGDPDSFLRPILSCDARGEGINLSKWCNEDFDFLLNLALEVDRHRYRLNLYKQAQNIINQEFPVIPIAHGMQFKAYNDSLTGFQLNPFNVQPFNMVERIK
ncbi:ABC transporter substrate-binding protein SapA [Vibrio spartinae]|uniref:Dipeptide-binding protein n=1 Tax=Vibrio spartinae TaxID=1918945 RepID=A0A1N6M6N7_9VIBR|nr:ABC transporter substrate-binding protein SapA [Vibrio spartinae]QMV14293.1 Dipeptide-binding protein [Vibrio spartinae]SIO95103.1 Periplasmic dipeptide transport protein precursor [Vibrio spartinae]